MQEPLILTREVYALKQFLDVTAELSGRADDPYIELVRVVRGDGTVIDSLSPGEKYDIEYALLAKLHKEKEKYDAENRNA